MNNIILIFKKFQQKIPHLALHNFPKLQTGGYREPKELVAEYLKLVHESPYWSIRIQRLKNMKFVFGT